MLICNDHRISLANIARNIGPGDADFRKKLEANGQKRIPDLAADNEEEFENMALLLREGKYLQHSYTKSHTQNYDVETVIRYSQ